MWFYAFCYHLMLLATIVSLVYFSCRYNVLSPVFVAGLLVFGIGSPAADVHKCPRCGHVFTVEKFSIGVSAALKESQDPQKKDGEK